MIQIHPTATVDEGASIGQFTSIWHYAHVERTAIVGENCSLGMSVYVSGTAIVGNACRVGNGVSVFSRVELDDFVFCAPFMVFTDIAFPRACVNRHEIYKRTAVRRGATLGANSTVVPGLTIGEGSFLAAGSTLTRNCKDWALMVGTPARQTGWVSAYGEKIPLPLVGKGRWECGHTGDDYLLDGPTLSRRPGPNDILKYVPGAKLVRIKGVDTPR